MKATTTMRAVKKDFLTFRKQTVGARVHVNKERLGAVITSFAHFAFSLTIWNTFCSCFSGGSSTLPASTAALRL